ncbi:hypothetical protein K431DRAFT_289688 [Polychaeton citri CBS 116435]|uniref:Uncharacterized protein n=1 Tax=Polychaeton citri CBS 116435 TaxID=1314669 RepID=A0A9P4PW85_9PEZI|nr:hypothetical protein K431DRAFT_289688 [Polychaeton citri CBS 116435]
MATDTTPPSPSPSTTLSKTFSIPSDNNGSTVEIRIAEPAGLKAEGLGLTTWGASLILANQLHHLTPEVRPAISTTNTSGSDSDEGPRAENTILELGAGTGLVGLAAAMLWKASGVVLTDLPPIVPGTSESCALNSLVLETMSVEMPRCGTLDWSQPSTLYLHPSGQQNMGRELRKLDARNPEHKFPTILSADTLYSEEQPEMLTKTIEAWLQRSETARAVVCYACRFAYLDVIREFWERMEGLGLECVAEGKADTEKGEDWREVGGTYYEWCVWRWKRE